MPCTRRATRIDPETADMGTTLIMGGSLFIFVTLVRVERGRREWILCISSPLFEGEGNSEGIGINESFPDVDSAIKI